ncbi:hypothetical protein [Streptomyces chrestomyceticus]
MHYALAGVRLLLHRNVWSMQRPGWSDRTRHASLRGGASRDRRWKGGGTPGCLALFQGRDWPGAETARGAALKPLRAHSGDADDRSGHQARLTRRAGAHPGRLAGGARSSPRPNSSGCWMPHSGNSEATLLVRDDLNTHHRTRLRQLITVRNWLSAAHPLPVRPK